MYMNLLILLIFLVILNTYLDEKINNDKNN
jgi:hypothetical protein